MTLLFIFKVCVNFGVSSWGPSMHAGWRLQFEPASLTVHGHYLGIMGLNHAMIAGLILGLRPANERQRYIVMTSLIGWAQP